MPQSRDTRDTTSGSYAVLAKDDAYNPIDPQVIERMREIVRSAAGGVSPYYLDAFRKTIDEVEQEIKDQGEPKARAMATGTEVEGDSKHGVTPDPESIRTSAIVDSEIPDAPPTRDEKDSPPAKPSSSSDSSGKDSSKK